MEHLVSVVVFTVGIAMLLIASSVVMQPFIYWKTIETPVAPSDDLAVRVLYVYNNSGRLYVVEHMSHADALFRQLGLFGELVAVFELYPGGYRCVGRAKIGSNPYTGLWCPPPKFAEVKPTCVPLGLVSRGMWLLMQYRCP